MQCVCVCCANSVTCSVCVHAVLTVSHAVCVCACCANSVTCSVCVYAVLTVSHAVCVCVCCANSTGNAMIVASILLHLESDQFMQLWVFSETLFLT